MSNFEAYAPLVDGSQFPIHDAGASCSKFVERVVGDDLRPPPQSITIVVTTELGKIVRLVIPVRGSKAIVQIDGKTI